MKNWNVKFTLRGVVVAEGQFSAKSADQARKRAVIALVGQNAIVGVTGYGMYVTYDGMIVTAL